MTNLTTYVLMVSEVFPKGMGMDGVNTYFPNKIRDGVKIHTIRTNYPFWKKRIDAVAAGKAVLSIRRWTGKPYRSSQAEIARFNHLSGIGIESVRLAAQGMPIVNDAIPVSPAIMAHNDGLTLEEFSAWFKDYDHTQEMAIIHFTSFRYSE